MGSLLWTAPAAGAINRVDVFCVTTPQIVSSNGTSIIAAAAGSWTSILPFHRKKSFNDGTTRICCYEGLATVRAGE
jgi:hypothetical protein